MNYESCFSSQGCSLGVMKDTCSLALAVMSQAIVSDCDSIRGSVIRALELAQRLIVRIAVVIAQSDCVLLSCLYRRMNSPYSSVRVCHIRESELEDIGCESRTQKEHSQNNCCYYPFHEVTPFNFKYGGKQINVTSPTYDLCLLIQRGAITKMRQRIVSDHDGVRGCIICALELA